MDPYQNTDDNLNQNPSDFVGSPYGQESQNNTQSGYPYQQQPVQSSQAGFDMNQPYQPPSQNPAGQMGMDGQGFATIQKPKSNMLLFIIGGVVLLGVIAAGGAVLFFSGRSSQAGTDIQNPVSPAVPTEAVEQVSQGLTVNDTEPVEESFPEDSFDEEEELGIGEESLPVTSEMAVSIETDAAEAFTSVGQPGSLVIRTDGEASEITAFDILIQFDPAAFDITEGDIVLLDESFDRFVFYKEHEDGLAHLTISGVRSPDVEDLSTGTDLLRLTFTPTAPGSYEFAVMDGYESETTKVIDEMNESVPLTLPDPVIAEIE